MIEIGLVGNTNKKLLEILFNNSNTSLTRETFVSKQKGVNIVRKTPMGDKRSLPPKEQGRKFVLSYDRS